VNQREIKQSIKDNPNLTATEKIQKLNEVRAPYKEMTDEELLQLVRDFTEENGREPMQADVLYDRELKQRFGPWNRMLEQAGTRPVAQSYLDKQQRRREKRARHKEYRRQLREQQAAEAEQGASAATEADIHQ
jgi:Asp-tRNA(Asn)/Glu-tRNA(Gln) amidotransferase A subunit family amidase